jgi:hypothetical protein
MKVKSLVSANAAVLFRTEALSESSLAKKQFVSPFRHC